MQMRLMIEDKRMDSIESPQTFLSAKRDVTAGFELATRKFSSCEVMNVTFVQPITDRGLGFNDELISRNQFWQPTAVVRQNS